MKKQDDPAYRQLLAQVKQIAQETDHSYGSRRMGKTLTQRVFSVSRGRARNLMKSASVQVKHKRKYRVTTNSNHKQPVFENVLKRNFSVARPDQAYASDITYVWTQEGWLYLAVVIDLYSRKVVGWSMSSRMKSDMVCNALKMAIWRRRPQPGLIHHSDRGGVVSMPARFFGNCLMSTTSRAV